MATCFLIQPFDRGAFDKRYEQILKPAIQAASLEPYRVDEDLESSILSEAIHRGIKDARVCLADITSDNPNVWYEIGYAFASRKEVVMICSDTRQRFPFDVQHRSIIIYQTESPADLVQLREKITKRLEAALMKTQEPALETDVTFAGGPLPSHEVALLVALAELSSNPSDPVFDFDVQQRMKERGYAPVAIYLATAGLTEKSLIANETKIDKEYGNYTLRRLTQEGTKWSLKNQEQFQQ